MTARKKKTKKAVEKKPLKFMASKNDSDDTAIATKEDDADLAVAKMPGALGTTDEDLQFHLLCQAILVFRGSAKQDGRDREDLGNYTKNALAILDGIKPQDEIEGMLAVQMIGVHNLAMETLQRAIFVGQTDKGKELNVNQATKMLRTFIAQIDALKKYRTGGQQKMIVEHVHVNEGGQAIVGTVNQGGVNDKKPK